MFISQNDQDAMKNSFYKVYSLNLSHPPDWMNYFSLDKLDINHHIKHILENTLTSEQNFPGNICSWIIILTFYQIWIVYGPLDITDEIPAIKHVQIYQRLKY